MEQFGVPAGAAPKSRALTVMTFNIHHGVGTDGDLDLQRVARVIDGAEPDVVGLQEVDRHWSERSGLVDQASWLANKLRMHVVYGANVDVDPLRPGEPRRQYGTAILTRSPILEWNNTPLPRFDRGEQRGLLRARIKVRGVPLTIYNTHLQFDDGAERMAQVAEIKRLIGRPEEPFVLMGDLNATPRKAEIRALADTMVDAWAQGGAGGGRTFPSRRPRNRIDYVLTSSDVVTRRAAVVTSDPRASDHLPVTAEILFPGGHGDL